MINQNSCNCQSKRGNKAYGTNGYSKKMHVNGVKRWKSELKKVAKEKVTGGFGFASNWLKSF